MAQVTLRMFAGARVAAGTGRDEVQGGSVGEVIDAACARYGPAFAEVLAASKVWLNGEPVDRAALLRDGDEVAVLPPVSGGCMPPVSGGCTPGPQWRRSLSSRRP